MKRHLILIGTILAFVSSTFIAAAQSYPSESNPSQTNPNYPPPPPPSETYPQQTYPSRSTTNYNGASTLNHGELGVFADYFRFSPVDPNINFVGVGGRVGFNANPHLAVEAEMSYDFARNYTTTTNNGATTTFVRTSVRPLTGLFGPKLQFGTSGPVRAFLTGKIGFINFSSSTTGAVTGSTFTNAVSDVGGSGTHLAAYPGGGLEGFWGPVGFRLDVGDEIYLSNGSYNNLRVTFGPAIRF